MDPSGTGRHPPVARESRIGRAFRSRGASRRRCWPKSNGSPAFLVMPVIGMYSPPRPCRRRRSAVPPIRPRLRASDGCPCASAGDAQRPAPLRATRSGRLASSSLCSPRDCSARCRISASRPRRMPTPRCPSARQRSRASCCAAATADWCAGASSPPPAILASGMRCGSPRRSSAMPPNFLRRCSMATARVTMSMRSPRCRTSWAAATTR